MKKKHKIELRTYDVPACGDGCCHDAFIGILVDDIEVCKVDWPSQNLAIEALLKHFNIEAEVKITGK